MDELRKPLSSDDHGDAHEYYEALMQRRQKHNVSNNSNAFRLSPPSSSAAFDYPISILVSAASGSGFSASTSSAPPLTPGSSSPSSKHEQTQNSSSREEEEVPISTNPDSTGHQSIVHEECHKLLTSSTATADDIFSAAASYVHDGFALRSINHGLARPALKIYFFRLRSPWFYFMRVLCVLQLCLALIESPSSFSFTLSDRAAASIEFTILLCFTFDVYLTYLALTRSGYVKSPWRIIKIGVLFISLLDTFVIICIGMRYFPLSRLLRVFFIAERSGRLRNHVKSLIRATPVIGNVVFLLALHVVVFGVVGWMAFSGMEKRDKLANEEDLFFQTLSSSIVNLFVCLTTANFPDVMMPVYRVNRATFFFFFFFLLVGLYLLMQLVLAVIFYTFKNHSMKDVAYYAKRADRALRAAFYLLSEVEIRKNSIHRNSWWNVLRHVRPDITEEQADVLFKAAWWHENIEQIHEKHAGGTNGNNNNTLFYRGTSYEKYMKEAYASINYSQFKMLCQFIGVEFIPFSSTSSNGPQDLEEYVPMERSENDESKDADDRPAEQSIRMDRLKPFNASDDLSNSMVSEEFSDDENELDIRGDEDLQSYSRFYRPVRIAHCERLSKWIMRAFVVIRGVLTWRLMNIVIDVLSIVLAVIVVIQAELINISDDEEVHDEHDQIVVSNLTIFSSIIVFLFVIEALYKLYVFRWQIFKKPFQSIDFYLVIGTFIGQILWFANAIIIPSFYLRSMRSLRIARALTHLHLIVRTILTITPAIVPLLFLQILVFYIFSILGMFFFANKLTPDRVPPDSDYAINLYFENNFDDLSHSYVSLFELLIGNNWYYLMDAAVDVTSPYARIFFVAFYCVAALIVMNVLIAFILEAFLLDQAAREREQKKANENPPSVTSSRRNSFSAGVEWEHDRVLNEKDACWKRLQLLAMTELHCTVQQPKSNGMNAVMLKLYEHLKLS